MKSLITYVCKSYDYVKVMNSIIHEMSEQTWNPEQLEFVPIGINQDLGEWTNFDNPFENRSKGNFVMSLR